VACFWVSAPRKVGSIVKISEKTLHRRLKSGARLKPDESERMALRELGGQTPLHHGLASLQEVATALDIEAVA